MATDEPTMQVEDERDWKVRPFCADCRHFRRAGLFRQIHLCAHDSAKNLITKEVGISAYDMRGQENRCGLDARYFEQKREGPYSVD